MKIGAVLLLCAYLLIAGCRVFGDTAEHQYDEATKRWNAGDYHNAVIEYFELVKAHPSSPKADAALYWAGVTQFLYLGETDKALQTLRLLLKVYPERELAPRTQWQIAQIYELGYGDYTQAIIEYRKAAQSSSADIREKSLSSLGDCLFRIGKNDEARDIWMKIVADFPGGQQARVACFRIGSAAMTQGDFKTGESYFRKALEHNNDQDLILKVKFALAENLELANSLKESLAIYKEIAQNYPNSAVVGLKIKAVEARIAKKRY